MVSLNLKIPADFFNEEERCGFLVTSEMKKVWAVELDLFAEFDRVCKKHNIKYYASGGTMLGAVRHKGFIPWDDDIDLMMFRDQYDKLCAIASSEFKHPYFFQTEYTDRGSFRGHAQLRNSDTTGILVSELNQNKEFNQGIFIDIFPLDNVIDSDELLEQQCNKMKYYKAKAIDTYYRFVYSHQKSLKVAIKRIIFPKILMNILKNHYYKKYEKTCALYNNCDLKKMSAISFLYNEKIHFNDKSDYYELINMPFEFMEIPVPSKYEHVLDYRYGNWRQFVKGGSLHGGVIFDTDISYKQYLKKAVYGK